jgi:hypothetical protein
VSAQAKEASKTTERNKDFNASGPAEGKMRTADMVLKVLDGLEGVTERQAAVGKATVAVGNAMLKLNEADGALEPYRSKGISKPDKACDPEAKSFSDAASAMNSLASERLSFISNLEKAGHVQPPPAN